MMSSTKAVICTTSWSTADDNDQPGLDEIICLDRAKNKAIWQEKLSGQKTTGNIGASREPAIALGTVAWDNMFEDDTVKVPETNFMNRLEQAITSEQFLQTTRNIVKEIGEIKDDFYKSNYKSL